MANTSSNRAIKIEDLQEKYNISDSDLVIVEDELDTKKAKVKELKKSFSGDYSDPSRYLYYSTQYINELLKNINIAITNKAPKEVIDELNTKLDAIITAQSSSLSGVVEVQEVIEARDNHTTLSDRLSYERDLSNSLYIVKPFKVIEGSKINIDGHFGLVNVTPVPLQETRLVTDAKGKIIYYSKNRLDLNTIRYNDSIIKINNGFKYIQNNSSTSKNEVIIPFTHKCDAGIYYFTANIKFSDKFNDKNISLLISYTDGSTASFPYDHRECFSFEASRDFSQIRLVYLVDSDGFNTNEYVEFANVMISKYKLESYVKYEYNETEQIYYNDTQLIFNDDFVFEYSISNTNLIIEYYDQSESIDTLLERMNSVETMVNDKIDRCGLMTDYGTYHSFETCSFVDSNSMDELSDASVDYERNGFTSKKVIKNGAVDLQIKQKLTNLPEPIESVSLCFYIDKLTIESFTDEAGLELILCSDNISYDNVNYYHTIIKRSEMIHGWNTIKRGISELSVNGIPDLYNIKSATIKVSKDINLSGKEFYLNSICFNQKMKPTVIISFDGTYENSNSSVYPQLTMRGIPATVLLNDSRTIDAEEFDELLKLRIENGWDIGSYGSHTKTLKKELLRQDNNFRNQYIGLLANKQYLQENVIYNPISYSAPYGDLRPITVPLLKELGYKIARTEADSYISIFTEKDFAIPMTLISNLITKDEIIAKIDYAIANNVAVSLFTRDVTEYGDEASAKTATFESIINYIYEKVQKGELQCLTMAEFYEKCTK